MRSGGCLQAVVFDLDGVLVDSESAWDAARRALVAESGGSWRASASTDMLGMSAREWSRYLHEELGVPLEPSEINDRVVARLLAGYERNLPLLPGAAAAVRRLAAVWTLGLASAANRPVIDAVLTAAGLVDCFTVTVSADEAEHGKPAPDVYLLAAKRLAVEPQQAAAVEDSTNGLRSAAAAGLGVIAAPNRDFPPAPDALELASLVVRSLDELTPARILAALC